MQTIETTAEEKPVSMNEVHRLGDTKKCPACGSEVDPGAYHCPRCRNYFCYRCRARVLPTDPQFQCLNQECDYHGKLVCGTCDKEAIKNEEPTIYFDRVGGWWPLLATCAVFLFIVALFYTYVWIALAIAIAAFAGGGFLLHRAGLNVFDTNKKVVEPRHSVHHSCIRCTKPVKASR
jgi:hypothetical protein